MRPNPPLRTIPITSAVFNRTVTPVTHQLLQHLLSKHWRLSSAGTGIQRTYEFRGFNGAMKFWNRVAEEAKAKRHHPEWANVYNRVEIRWTTHNPKGLGHIDVEMAELCDKIAEEVGLKNATPNPEEAKEEGVKEANDNGILDGIIPAGTECEPCAKGGQKPL